MKVAFFGYREWSARILANLLKVKSLNWTIVDDPYDYISHYSADVLLYYGWSEMIPEELYNSRVCLILHPSPLPKYRGGSPLQHQIINGEKESAVTICRVADKLDAGDIYSQTSFSLDGSLDEIFRRIVEIGTQDTIKVLDSIANNTIQPIVQDESEAAVFKRRTPEESELTLKDFESKSAEELYNFIRALADPYPNAFIKCKDGKKLYLTKAHL